MTSLKCWNSGVELNGSAFILSPLGCGASFRVPAVSGEEDASSILQALAGQLLVGDSASDNLFHYSNETLRVRGLAVVVAKCLFIDIAEQVERLNADVRAMQATLQETPEVFHRVGVDLAVHVLHGVVDDGVLIVVFKSVIGLQFIGEDRGPGFNMFTHLFLQFRFASVVYNHRTHVSVALHHAKHHGLVLAARAGNDALAFRLVHVSGFAADEGLINLDLSAELIESALLHGETNAMEHKPRGLLGNTESAMDLITADTVFATNNQPCGSEPFFKWDRRVFEDRPSLQREGRTFVFRVALPDAIFGEVGNVARPALRALHDAISPPQRSHKLAAVFEIGEPEDRVSKGIWGFHASSMRPITWKVKYIITLICPAP